MFHNIYVLIECIVRVFFKINIGVVYQTLFFIVPLTKGNFNHHKLFEKT